MREYQLKRSQRRTLALELTREGKLLVRAPNWLSQGEVDRFIAEKEGWIASHLARWEAQPPCPAPTREEEERLRTLARAVLPGRVDYFSRRMGLFPTGVKITSARTRFGSCSGRDSLCFSWRLMAYPAEAVDYVVVHELAHIAHKNHSREFYQRVAQELPDYQRRRALLSQPAQFGREERS